MTVITKAASGCGNATVSMIVCDMLVHGTTCPSTRESIDGLVMETKIPSLIPIVYFPTIIIGKIWIFCSSRRWEQKAIILLWWKVPDINKKFNSFVLNKENYKIFLKITACTTIQIRVVQRYRDNIIDTDS